MIPRKAILLALALTIANKASALPQPCGPLRVIASHFIDTPIQDDVGEFYRSGERNSLDYRVLASISKFAGNAGATICGQLFNDPFHNNPAQCSPHMSFQSAISVESDYVGQNYIAVGQPDFYVICHHYDVTAPMMPSGCNVEANIFSDMLGDPHSPVLYTSGCCGDCNGNQNVSINELILAVNMNQCQGSTKPECGSFQYGACPAADTDYSGNLFITDLIRMVNSAFGCAAS